MTQTQKKTLGMAILSLIFGCFFIIPIFGMLFGVVAIVLGIIALVKISNNSETLKGKGLAISGIVLGAISILVIPVLTLMAAIAIPNLLRARLNANEARAEATVRTISSAITTFSALNNGIYPQNEMDLMNAEPPYLGQSYDGKTIAGYDYSISLRSGSYRIVAKPEKCGMSGVRIFISDTGKTFQQKCE